jgi:hypothetical protein
MSLIKMLRRRRTNQNGFVSSGCRDSRAFIDDAAGIFGEDSAGGSEDKDAVRQEMIPGGNVIKLFYSPLIAMAK